MASEYRNYTARYRKLDDVQGKFSQTSLQKLLSAAMEQEVLGEVIESAPKSREFKEGEEFGTILLNDFEKKKTFFFGQLVWFEPGSTLPLIKVSEKRKFYNLEQQQTPDGYEPIRGMVYFLSINDHFFFIQDGLRIGRAEDYINWLLRDCCEVCSKEAQIILSPILTSSDGQSLRLARVDTVKFKPEPLDYGTVTETRQASQSSAAAVEPDVVERVLKAAGWHETDIYKLTKENTQIELTLQIKFKEERAIHSLNTSDVARLLRDMPEDQLTLYGPDGREKNGEIVQFGQKEKIKVVGKFIATEDAIEALTRRYKEFVQNGYIHP